MDLITSFFTETPTITEMYYVILGLSLLGFFVFRFLPEKTALKLFVPYQLISHRAFLHKKDKREYNWSIALRRQSIVLLGVASISILILVLANMYGTIVSKVGLGVLAIVVLLGALWVDPARN